MHRRPRSPKGVILTHVDRKFKYTKLAILPDESTASVQKACDASLLSIAHKIETITYDNGKDFAGRARMSGQAWRSKSTSPRRIMPGSGATNEHTNGLVRQYFPKGSDFSTLTPADVQRVEDKLNSRPRKTIGYKTPSEVFLLRRRLCSTKDTPMWWTPICPSISIPFPILNFSSR